MRRAKGVENYPRLNDWKVEKLKPPDLEDDSFFRWDQYLRYCVEWDQYTKWFEFYYYRSRSKEVNKKTDVYESPCNSNLISKDIFKKYKK